VEPSNPSKVWTLNKEDADTLKKYFWNIGVTTQDDHPDLTWKFSLKVPKEVTWEEWEQRLRNTVEIRFSLQDDKHHFRFPLHNTTHLSIVYSPSGSRLGDAYRKVHYDLLRYGYSSTAPTPSEEHHKLRLTIKCGFKVLVDPSNPSKVWTLNKEDADTLKKYFCNIGAINQGHHPDSAWKFSLKVPEKITWDKWVQGRRSDDVGSTASVVE
jgi:hypothetical protein